jgi:hypothetical protein
MIMTCLRYLSLCPCPWCLVLKSRIPMIGTKTDTRQRIRFARVDSHQRRKKIELARKLMFERGVNVTSEKIENFYGPHLLFPLAYVFLMIYCGLLLILTCRMHSRSAYSLTDSTSMICLFLIYSMNLS